MTFRSKPLVMLVMLTVSMQLVTICAAQTKSETVTAVTRSAGRSRSVSNGVGPYGTFQNDSKQEMLMIVQGRKWLQEEFAG